MKSLKVMICVVIGSVIGSGGIALAEKMYVTDQLKLTVRTNPDRNSTIITVLASGNEVEVVASSAEWSRVMLADDRQGWVLSRYLTNRETSARKLKRLQNLHKSLTLQNADLLKENAALKQEVGQLRKDINQKSKAVEKLDSAFSNLKEESSDYLKLKAKHEKTVTQLNAHTEMTASLKTKIDKLESRQTTRWLLTGAGVLLLGFIIGFSTRRQRRKPSLLH